MGGPVLVEAKHTRSPKLGERSDVLCAAAHPQLDDPDSGRVFANEIVRNSAVIRQVLGG
ncbi:TPA: hypothetical protein ACXI1H_000531 [Stenotrophomonas maltophilia]